MQLRNRIPQAPRPGGLIPRLAWAAAALAAAALLLPAASSAGGSPAAYQVEDVGFAGFGDKYELPLDEISPAINSAGQVAGGSITDYGFHAHRAGADLMTLLDLGVLTEDYGFSNGWAINDPGQVAGISTYPGAYRSVFRFTDGPGMEGGVVEAYYSAGRGINDSGDVVGEYSNADVVLGSGSFGGAFVWPAGEGAQALSSSKLPDAIAFDINNQDLIVGAVRGFEGETYAAGWFPGSEGWDEPVPVPVPDDPNNFGRAFAANDGGSVCGDYLPGSGGSRASGLYYGYRGFVFLPDFDSLDIGLLPNGTWSVALALNNLNAVVGAADRDVPAGARPAGYGAGNYARAVLFTEAGLQDLNDLIPSESGWELLKATGINDAGQIVGVGLLNGVPRVFRLTPSGGGRISARPSPVTFGQVVRGNSRSRDFEVRNTGAGPVTVTVLGAGGAFSVRPGSFTLQAGDVRRIAVKFLPRRLGRFRNSVRLRTNSATQPSLSVPVSGYACRKAFE